MSMVQIMDVYGDLISRLKDPDVSDFVIVRKDAFFIKNPVLIFNSWFKAGDFLFASDTEYNCVLERVERFSSFWLNQPELSALSMARYIVLFSSISNDVRYDNKPLNTRVVWDFPHQLREISLMMHNLREESRLAASKRAPEDVEREVDESSPSEEKEKNVPDVLEFIRRQQEDFDPLGLEDVSKDYDPVAKAAKEGLLDDFFNGEK